MQMAQPLCSASRAQGDVDIVRLRCIWQCPRDAQRRHPRCRFFKLSYRLQYRDMTVRDEIYSAWPFSAKSTGTRKKLLITSANALRARDHCRQIWSSIFQAVAKTSIRWKNGLWKSLDSINSYSLSIYVDDKIVTLKVYRWTVWLV